MTPPHPKGNGFPHQPALQAQPPILINISLERKKCQVNPLKMTLCLPRGFCERHRESFVSGHMCHVQASLKDIASSIPEHEQKRISNVHYVPQFHPFTSE
jgi:ferredoxin